MKSLLVNNVRLHIANDYQEASTYAADIIAEYVIKKPKSSLLLSTGTSQLGIYNDFINKYSDIFSHTTIFNMYEYCLKTARSYRYIDSNSPVSFQKYMRDRFLNKIRVRRHYFPDILNASEKGHYDRFIQKQGGINLALAAIGEDGHTFGFNLPGCKFTDSTRLVQINPFNREIIRKLTASETPEYAITTGIATGMAAKKIVFIATGLRKSSILKSIITSPISNHIPATVLRNHKDCTWIIDNEAATNLF